MIEANEPGLNFERNAYLCKEFIPQGSKTVTDTSTMVRGVCDLSALASRKRGIVRSS